MFLFAVITRHNRRVTEIRIYFHLVLYEIYLGREYNVLWLPKSKHIRN